MLKRAPRITWADAILLSCILHRQLLEIYRPVWTDFTGLGFALGGTITEFLASCFFVYCKQPYDVGGRVTIDSKDLIVQEIHLDYSVFSLVGDDTVQQICHSKLLEMWIANKTRTKTRSSTDTIRLTAKCNCTDKNLVQAKLNEWLAEPTGNTDCRRHLEAVLLTMANISCSLYWFEHTEIVIKESMRQMIAPFSR